MHRVLYRSYSERAKAFPFQPPAPSTHYLRVTSFLNTSNPSDPLSAKKLLRVPISRLPLDSPESVKRFKLLAGTRWIPPKDKDGNLAVNADGTLVEGVEFKKGSETDEKEGWFEMSEEGWKEGRMNRKWLSDVLDGLVKESNVSPLASNALTNLSFEIH
jgi:small subunit ribosomal protein S35